MPWQGEADASENNNVSAWGAQTTGVGVCVDEGVGVDS
jgi:hypothetical protein